MKLASYKVRGRESFGAVVGEGVVDLKTRLAPQFTSVLDLLRAGGLDFAREVVQGVRADFPIRTFRYSITYLMWLFAAMILDHYLMVHI